MSLSSPLSSKRALDISPFKELYENKGGRREVMGIADSDVGHRNLFRRVHVYP